MLRKLHFRVVNQVMIDLVVYLVTCLLGKMAPDLNLYRFAEFLLGFDLIIRVNAQEECFIQFCLFNQSNFGDQ